MANLSGFSHSSVQLYEPIRALIYSRYKDKLTDIGFHGPGMGWATHVEKGRIILPPRDTAFVTLKYFQDLCSLFAANLGIRFDKKLPIVACRTPDGDRFQAMTGVFSDTGISVAIRIKRMKTVTWDSFEVSDEHRDLIAGTVSDGGAVLLSGSTGSGKTTFLNMLAGGYIPLDDRVMTIEDTREIDIPHKNKEHLLVPRIEAEGGMTWALHIDHCLRSDPDVIIPQELSIKNAFPILQCMDTGHDSTMFTMHANSPADAITGFRRRVAMGGAPDSETSSTEEFLAETVNLIVQLKHKRHDANNTQRRVVTDVISPKEALARRRRGNNVSDVSMGRLSPDETMSTIAQEKGLVMCPDEKEEQDRKNNKQVDD